MLPETSKSAQSTWKSILFTLTNVKNMYLYCSDSDVAFLVFPFWSKILLLKNAAFLMGVGLSNQSFQNCVSELVLWAPRLAEKWTNSFFVKNELFWYIFESVNCWKTEWKDTLWSPKFWFVGEIDGLTTSTSLFQNTWLSSLCCILWAPRLAEKGTNSFFVKNELFEYILSL